MAARAAERPANPVLPGDQAADGRRSGFGRRRGRGRPLSLRASLAVRHRRRAGRRRRLVRFRRRPGGRGSVRADAIPHDRSPRRFLPVSGRRPGGDRRHRGDPVARDPPGGRPLRGDDPQGPAGPCLRHRPFADGRRGDVSALRLVPGLSPDRRAVDDLSQPGRGGQRPAPGDVPGKRAGLRPGPLAQLRDLARRLRSWPSPPAAATP